MEDFEKQVEKRCEEEVEKLLKEGGLSVLDFDKLCSTVALQTQGKLCSKQELESFHGSDYGEVEFGSSNYYYSSNNNYGAFRMWEGDVLPDCCLDRQIAFQSFCCPCYRFGKNMKRAGFGSSLLQGTAYFLFILSVVANMVTFIITRQHCFLYLAAAFFISLGMYLGFFRTQMKKKFNIRGSNSSANDYVYHVFCSSCTLCQESRTLEMNNIQDGVWHGRGDTFCIGTYSEGNKALSELHPPPVVSV